VVFSFPCLPLGTYARVRSGFAFKSKDWTEHGIPVVKIANVKNGELVMDGCSYVPDHVAQNAREWLLRRGDILIAMTGYIGDVARIRDDSPRLLNQRVGRFEVVDPNKLDREYLFYVLRNAETKHKIAALGHGSAQPNVSPSAIHSIEIPLPKLAEQQAIASTLCSLDDKIEQNRRTGAKFEELARAVFKAWFVDFEPVKAKAAGAKSFPGMPDDAFAALPTTFQDSPLGPVPKGWDTGTLGDVFEVGVGGQWGEDEPSERASLAARCLRGIDCHQLASGVLPDVPRRFLKPELAAKRILTDGVVLVEGSGSFCGRSFFWRQSYASLFDEPVLYTNFTKRLDARLSASQSLIGWLHMRTAYDAGGMSAHRTGSAFPNLDLDGLLSTSPLAIPPKEMSDPFAEIFNALNDPHYIHESRKLAELRDYLLPRLLSGKVRVDSVSGGTA
jgi:type I restriction enzyme S subunit